MRNVGIKEVDGTDKTDAAAVENGEKDGADIAAESKSGATSPLATAFEKSPGILESRSTCRDKGADIAEPKFGSTLHLASLNCLLSADQSSKIFEHIFLHPKCWKVSMLVPYRKVSRSKFSGISTKVTWILSREKRLSLREHSNLEESRNQESDSTV